MIALLNNVASAFICIGLSLLFCWQVGLFGVALILFLIVVEAICGYRVHKATMKKNAVDKSDQVAQFDIPSTVSSFVSKSWNKLEPFSFSQLKTSSSNVFTKLFKLRWSSMKRFDCIFSSLSKGSFQRSRTEALNFAFSQSFMFLADMGGWLIGGELIYRGMVATNRAFL